MTTSVGGVGRDALTERLRRVPAVARAIVATVRDLLVAAILWLGVGWTLGGAVAERIGLVLAALVVVLATVRGAGALLLGRARLDPLFVARLDRRFGLQDQLRTWASSSSAPAVDGAVRRWLDRSVRGRLERVHDAEVRAEAWPSWRPVRRLGLVLAVLVLLRLLALVLPVPALGPAPLLTAAGGGGSAAAGNGGEGPGAPGAGVPGPGNAPGAAEGPEGETSDGDELPGDERPDEPSTDDGAEAEDDEPDDGPPEILDGPGSGAAGDEAPEGAGPQGPKDLLDLDFEQSFLLPGFVREGESADGTAPAAVVERSEEPLGPQAAAGAADAQSTPRDPQGEGGVGPDDEPPSPAVRSFERAAERALRARHVPDEERAIVRRWFERLRPGREAPGRQGPRRPDGGR